MATTNLSIWRDRHWLTISQQLQHAFQIDASNFESGRLKKETPNGEWLHSWLGRVYNDYSTTARETAMIRVVPPDNTSNNIYALILDITVRRHEAIITARFPVPFGVIAPAVATSVATSVASTSAGPTTAETATAGPSSMTAPTTGDVPGPSSSSSGKKPL